MSCETEELHSSDSLDCPFADAQVYTGFNEWDQTSESETVVPKGIKIAFWVLLAVEAFAYAAGWAIMEPLGRNRRKKEMEGASIEKVPRNSTSGLLRNS